MKRAVWSVVLALLVVGAPSATERQSRPVPLQVGAHIPDFHAVDQSGKERGFNDLVGPKGLVIFFYKSADW